MRKLATSLLIALVLLFCSVSQSFRVVRGQTQNMNYTVKMSVTYSNPSAGAQTWSFTEEDRTISLFQNNTWQTVQLTNSTLPIETGKNDADGNPVAVLEFPGESLHLNPGQNLTFTSTYRVVSKPRSLPPITEDSSGRLQDIPEDLSEEYTGEEGPWLTSDSTLQNLAHSIVGNETKVLTIIKMLVSWIDEKIDYGTHEVPFYANETYANRTGDCDDQAILLITLSRILGIPAYLQVGAIYMPSIPYDLSTYWEGHVKELAKRIGWHGWAVVYVPPWGWLPVDLTFTWGGGAAPLRAIENAAVTSQYVIQYINITKSDYVASSHQARDFLINNDFYVYLEDEMIEEAGSQGPFGEGSGEWLMVGLFVVVIILVAGTLFTYRRLKRWTQKEEETPQSQK